jgi:hypothetical protein
MKKTQTDLLQGTLDLLVLKTLQAGPTHGWDIAQRIQQVSQGILHIGQGSLYPALHRMNISPPLRRLKEMGALRAGNECKTTTLLANGFPYWRNYIHRYPISGVW